MTDNMELLEDSVLRSDNLDEELSIRSHNE